MIDEPLVRRGLEQSAEKRCAKQLPHFHHRPHLQFGQQTTERSTAMLPGPDAPAECLVGLQQDVLFAKDFRCLVLSRLGRP